MTQMTLPLTLDTRTVAAIVCNGDGTDPRPVRTEDGPQYWACTGCPNCAPLRFRATERMVQIHANPWKNLPVVDDSAF